MTVRTVEHPLELRALPGYRYPLASPQWPFVTSLHFLRSRRPFQGHLSARGFSRMGKRLLNNFKAERVPLTVAATMKDGSLESPKPNA